MQNMIHTFTFFHFHLIATITVATWKEQQQLTTEVRRRSMEQHLRQHAKRETEENGLEKN